MFGVGASGLFSLSSTQRGERGPDHIQSGGSMGTDEKA